jgi:hypothetical protein
MENEEDCEFGAVLRDMVEDWGVSQTTLEEVFMRVTGLKASESLDTS